MLAIEFPDVYGEIVTLLLVATVVGAVAVRLRQPLIVAFIAAGILVGPSGLGWVRATEELHLFAELGLAILLFVVGLRLDLGLIRTVGPVALATGLGQVAFTSAVGYFIALGLGMPPLTAVYVAVALTFSSTIIIVKLLSDKRETDSLHGRIAVGFLIVQDILVVLAMIVLSAFAGRGDDIALRFLLVFGKGAGLLLGLGLLTYFVLPRLLNRLARSPELLVLFAITWAAFLALVAELLGFSNEVGAFLAGVSLASTTYRELLGARLVTLRDFLLLFFFVELGTRLDLGLLGAQVWAAIPLSLFVLIGNPLIVMIIMGVMGYRRRTSFLAGLTVAQISEFSLILVALGLGLGHIGEDSVGLVTLVGLITIGLSTYMILYSHRLYDYLSPYLRVFERRVPHKEQAQAGEIGGRRVEPEIILFGLGRYGGGIARDLMAQKRRVLGVDFDPQAVRRWNERGWPAMFGDAEDAEFAAELPLSHARWVVSSVRDRDVNVTLMQALRSHGYRGSIAATAYSAQEADELRKESADVVFVPFTDAASQAVDILNAADARESRRRMDRLIASLNDHYIVCGYGRMGQQIVKEFQRHQVPFMVIEWNPDQIPKLTAQNVPFIEGKATEDEVQIAAGIHRARGLVAVTATDEENVFIVLTARGLNPNLLIAARSILEENEGKLERAGADRVMSPYVLGGRAMAAAILKPGVRDFLDLVTHGDHLDVDMSDTEVCPASPIVGKNLRDSGIRQLSGANVLAVRRPGEGMIPNPTPDFVIQAGDQVIVMGSQAQLDGAEGILSGR